MDNIQPCLPGADILFLKHDSGILSGPTLYVVHGRAKPVLRGPNNTEPNLFHHGETTYRVGGLSEYATVMLSCFRKRMSGGVNVTSYRFREI